MKGKRTDILNNLTTEAKEIGLETNMFKIKYITSENTNKNTLQISQVEKLEWKLTCLRQNI